MNKITEIREQMTTEKIQMLLKKEEAAIQEKLEEYTAKFLIDIITFFLLLISINRQYTNNLLVSLITLKIYKPEHVYKCIEITLLLSRGCTNFCSFG